MILNVNMVVLPTAECEEADTVIQQLCNTLGNRADSADRALIQRAELLRTFLRDNAQPLVVSLDVSPRLIQPS